MHATPLRRSLRTLLLLTLLTPVLGASKCKRAADDVDADDGLSAAQGIEVRLGIVRIFPSSGPEAESFEATVYGSGFEPGARVQIGALDAPSVQRRDANTLTVTVPALPSGRFDVHVINPDGGRTTLRSALTIEEAGAFGAAGAADCRHITVNFAFDRDDLTADAKRSLEAALPCYNKQSGSLRIEGHCDERGTTEYNLALGERRATSVKRWLQGKGIPANRLRTTSFGKERPVDASSNEAAWAKNRRAEIHLDR